MPIDLGGMRSTGIHAYALQELQARLGKDPASVKVYDCGQFLGWPDEALRARFHLDVVALEPPNRNTESDDWHRWEPRPGFSFLMPKDFLPELQPDGSWILTDKSWNHASRMPRNGFYFDDVDSPMAVRTVVSVKDYAPTSTYEDEWLDSLSRRADWLWRNTDCAILGSFFGGSMFNLNIGGMVNWMEMLVTEPELAREYVEKSCDAMIRRARLFHQAAGDKVFALVIGDDMGTQRGELYSPATFRAVNAPGYKRFCQWVHANTNYKVFLHCCGSIYHYMETLIDCGIDILNPVQTSAANMEPRRLVKEFGGRIVFWGGGCDTQRVLPFGTPEEVREHVRERIGVFRPSNGFVFNQVHNIQANVPVDNIIAMLDTAYEYAG